MHCGVSKQQLIRYFKTYLNTTPNNYIMEFKTAKAKEVAEAVQAGVKEKIQSMTGNAVTKVNVYVMDAIEEPEEE